ncbi:MAG: YeeE/YedE family protein [Chitinophagales bacterium]|nr:YeeE/YedE family protein [Chitinophagales bacterium]
MESIYQTWPWYVSGPLISLVMFLLLFMGKQFGVSSNLKTMCAIGGAGKFADYFKIDWKAERWNLLFVFGGMIGGFIATHFLSADKVVINEKIAQELADDYHIESAGQAFLPTEIFSNSVLSDPYHIAILLVAGILIGFGTRYAGGCTSGHSISGLSNLQLPSLIATIGFFIGGLMMIHFLFPIIF